MEQLVVRLGSELNEPIFWLVWSSVEQEIIASGELTDASQLESLPERSGHRNVIALVPSSDVFLKWVELPPKAGRKALAAIPFMLEDDLSADISDQFFAMGEKQTNRQAVAVVSNSKMLEWLEALKQADLNCTKMLPDVLALPYEDNCWTLLALNEQMLIRQDNWQGIQGNASWVLPATEHYAKQQTEPVSLNNYSDYELPQLANINVTQMPLDMPMQVLAQGALKAKFNLLQGDYKPKRQSSRKLGQWRWAAVLTGLVLLTSLVDKGLELKRLSSQNEQLSAQIRTEFKRGFPNTAHPRILRKTVGTMLTSLENGGGGISVLVLMSQLSEAFETSNVKPQTLRYDSKRGELRILAVADNFEELEQFKRLAEESGFDVQQGAINNKDNQVIGSLSIRS